MMWLVLCTPEDESALWAYQGLKARGLTPLRIVSADSLVYSLRACHRLGHDGVSVDITLGDGFQLRSGEVRGVLNRLVSLPTWHSHLVRREDRDYAVQETTAFLTSWLYSLGAVVVNRPSPLGLSGQWRHVSEWRMLAHSAGLPTEVFRQGSSDGIEVDDQHRVPLSPDRVATVTVIGEHVISPESLPSAIGEGCRSLADLTSTPLLGVDFLVHSRGDWRFTAATPFPDLGAGGDTLLEALGALLRGGTNEGDGAAVRDFDRDASRDGAKPPRADGCDGRDVSSAAVCHV